MHFDARAAERRISLTAMFHPQLYAQHRALPPARGTLGQARRGLRRWRDLVLPTHAGSHRLRGSRAEAPPQAASRGILPFVRPCARDAHSLRLPPDSLRQLPRSQAEVPTHTRSPLLLVPRARVRPRVSAPTRSRVDLGAMPAPIGAARSTQGTIPLRFHPARSTRFCHRLPPATKSRTGGSTRAEWLRAREAARRSLRWYEQ